MATRWRREPTAASSDVEQRVERLRRQLAELHLTMKTLINEIEANSMAQRSAQEAMTRAAERDGRIFAPATARGGRL